MASEPAPEQRLHPSSVFFLLFGQIRAFLGIVIGGAVLTSLERVLVTAPFVFGIAGIVAGVRYWTYRYRLERDEIVIRQGLVFRSERHVPYGRIQNVNLARNPLHRLFGVAEARLETAGGSEPEATMRVLSLDAVERIRQEIFRGRASSGDAPAPASSPAEAIDAPADEDPGETVASLGARDIAVLGIVSDKGMVVIAAAVGVLWNVLPDRMWEPTVQAIRARLGAMSRPGGLLEHLPALPGPFWAAIAIAVTAVIAVVALRVLSIGWAWVQFHGFRLVRRGDDLRADYGLFTRVTATTPRRRIQLLSVRAGWLHRRFRRVAVAAETAGGTAGGEEGSDRPLWIAPIAAVSELARLVRGALPDVDLDAVAWRPLARRARGRVFRRALLRVVVLGAFAAAVTRSWWGLAVFVPGAGWAWLHAVRYVRHTGWALTPHAVLYRSGWWNRRTSVVPFAKIQVVRTSATPFDRRARMAGVRVDTAGSGKVGHRVDVRYLDREVAAELAEHLLAEAGRRSFRWA